MTRSDLTTSDRNSPSHRSEVLFSPAVQKGQTKTISVFIPKRSNQTTVFQQNKIRDHYQHVSRLAQTRHLPCSLLLSCLIGHAHSLLHCSPLHAEKSIQSPEPHYPQLRGRHATRLPSATNPPAVDDSGRVIERTHRQSSRKWAWILTSY